MCARGRGAVLRRDEFTGVRLSREFAAPTQIVVGSELGAAKGLRKSGVIDTATRATSFLPRSVSPTVFERTL